MLVKGYDAAYLYWSRKKNNDHCRDVRLTSRKRQHHDEGADLVLAGEDAPDKAKTPLSLFLVFFFCSWPNGHCFFN